MRRLLAAAIATVFLCAGSAGVLTRAAAGATCPIGYSCFTLTVKVAGNGSGSWLSTDSSYVPDGYMHCTMHDGTVVSGSVCAFTYKTRLQLYSVWYLMKPAVGSNACEFGFCSTTMETSSVNLTNDVTLIYDSFNLESFNVTVTKSGAGTGEVVADPGRLDCGVNCTYPYNYDTVLKLTASPDPGAYFQGWTQDCAGQVAVCTVTVGLSTKANAVFGLGTPPPSSTPKPTPTAKATATPRATATARPTTPATQQPTGGPPTGAPATDTGLAATAAPSTSIPAAQTATPTAIAALPAATTPPPTLAAVPTSSTPASPTDYTPIAVALLLGLIAIAVAIGFVGYQVRRRS